MCGCALDHLVLPMEWIPSHKARPRAADIAMDNGFSFSAVRERDETAIVDPDLPIILRIGRRGSVQVEPISLRHFKSWWKPGLGFDFRRDIEQDKAGVPNLIKPRVEGKKYAIRPATAKLKPASLSTATMAARLKVVASQVRTRPGPRFSVQVCTAPSLINSLHARTVRPVQRVTSLSVNEPAL